jgi:hypothetical protein
VRAEVGGECLGHGGERSRISRTEWVAAAAAAAVLTRPGVMMR